MTPEKELMLKVWIDAYKRDEDRIESLKAELCNFSTNPDATEALATSLINAAKTIARDLAKFKDDFDFDENDIRLLANGGTLTPATNDERANTMEKITIRDQDLNSVVINVDDDGYASIVQRTFANGAEIFYLNAETDETDDGIVCIGIFRDRAEAEDALENLEENRFVAGVSMTATVFAKAIGEYRGKYAAELEDMTALEYVNRAIG